MESWKDCLVGNDPVQIQRAEAMSGNLVNARHPAIAAVMAAQSSRI
jgi:hypothetical protein